MPNLHVGWAQVADTKIEAVTVWMFQKGLLLCKYGWKDLRSKQPKVCLTWA